MGETKQDKKRKEGKHKERGGNSVTEEKEGNQTKQLSYTVSKPL